MAVVPAPRLRALGVTILAAAVALLALTMMPSPAGASGPHARTAFETAVVKRLVAQVNRYRSDNGLPALSTNSRLAGSARWHSWRMAVRQDLDHQVAGEQTLGTRISAAGYGWHSIGENIGWTSDRSAAGAARIISAMYAEKAPNDSHRRNMLSRSFANIGMDVYDDPAHGRLWLTTDFGHH